ncbi:hypothetical protein GCM10027203_70200 [Nonomuraea fastidiosa]
MPSAKRTSAATTPDGVRPTRSPGLAVRAGSPGRPGTITGASVPTGDGPAGAAGDCKQPARANATISVTITARVPKPADIASIVSYETKGMRVDLRRIARDQSALNQGG